MDREWGLILVYKPNNKHIAMRFTGDIHDECPITLTPVTELENPVGFDSKRAYECDDLIAWLRTKPRNPVTREKVDASAIFIDVLQPLIVNDDCIDKVPITQMKLQQAGRILPFTFCAQVNMLVFSTCFYMSSLTTVKNVLGEPNAMLFLFTATVCSFAVLTYDVCNKHRSNGIWNLIGICQVGAFCFVMMEVATGHVFDHDFNLYVTIAEIHTYILAMKLLADIIDRQDKCS